MIALRSASYCSDLAYKTIRLAIQAYILLSQANVWTEYIGNEPTVEYMLLPRVCAMAEVLWSPAAAKDWDSFLQRLPVLLAHFEATGLRYRPLG
jgi:hexosaminidase